MGQRGWIAAASAALRRPGGIVRWGADPLKIRTIPIWLLRLAAGMA